MRWLGDVDQDSERLGERNWRRQARNNDEWKKLLSIPGAVEPMVLMMKTIFYCPRRAICSVFYKATI